MHRQRQTSREPTARPTVASGSALAVDRDRMGQELFAHDFARHRSGASGMVTEGSIGRPLDMGGGDRW